MQGIHNAALFGASQRSARNKLEMMGGIKRGPSGILASSSELMQAVTPPTIPKPMVTPQATMPMVQAALPQVPVQTTVAPMVQQAPVQQQVPAVPTVPQPASPSTPMGFQPGGPVDAEGRRRRKDRVDITEDPVTFIQKMDQESDGAIIEKFGTPEKALEKARDKALNINSALDAKDSKEVGDAVMVAAELPPTNESKIDFAQSVLGIDTDDVGEIDDAIFRVLTSDPSLSGQKLQQAVLLGLNNYKQTAAARAAAASGGKSGMSPLEPFADAVRDLAGKIIQSTGKDAPEAMKEAADTLRPFYEGNVSMPSQTQTQTLRQQVEEALKLEPKRREAILKQATEMGVDIKGL